MTLFAAIEFENVDRPWLWWLLLAAGAALMYYTYRGIFQRSERRLTWGLMALRALGLMALVAVLAHPSWVRQTEDVDSGRVAVVVDNSLSMSLAGPGGKSRYALAQDAVERLRSALAERKGPKLQIDLFDVQGARLSEGLPSEPRAERTDLLLAVNKSATQLRSRPLAGIVLISDGSDNTGREGLAGLASFPTPIYTVGYPRDTEASRMDLAVRRATAPARVMVDNDVKVEIAVSKSAGPETEATVVVRRGQTEFARQTVTLPAGDAEQTVNVTITPREAGQLVFTAAVSAPAGERLAANNAQHFPLEVDAQPIRVFYLEGYLRHEYKYLKARLEDDPDVSLVTVVRRANPEAQAENSGGNLLTAERLANFDVVILGDMEGDYLAPAEYQALIQWVQGDEAGKNGHALLVLGGYQSFGPNGFRNTPLAAALPVEFAEEPPLQSEDPFVLELTPEGQRHPIFEVTGDRVQDGKLWAGSPPLLGASLVRAAKPGAEVLATNPSLVVGDRPAVVVATQRYGVGRTLTITADTTWRWTRLARVRGQADTLFARFWSQTIRWLAGREKAEERPPLVVSTDRPDYAVGKKVTVRAVRQPRPGEDQSASAVTVEITDEGGASQTVEMRARPSQPDQFEGSFYPSAGGRYVVAASLTADGSTVANHTTEFLVHGKDLELADVGTNAALLQAISSQTGGLYVDIDQAADLAGKITGGERRTTRVQRSEFGNSPWLFLFFLAAVTSEWVIRRRNHLV